MSRDPRRGGRDAAPPRTNEYFVPREGIDREVITADICRYLGNDALVRPGTYENPQTRQPQSGYFITAYRNLTTAMIADLKADSERWENERRATSSRGQPSNVEYRASTTHQSRQYYGPTEPAPAAAPAAYSQPSSASGGPSDYGQSSYPSSAYSQQSPSPYGQPSGYPQQDGNYAYVSGGNLENDQATRGRGAPLPQQGQIPRTGYPAQATTSYADGRGDNSYYPAQAQAAQNPAQYAPQTSDPYYSSRAAPVAGYDPQESDYNNRGYPDQSQYPQGQPPPTTATAHPAAAPRREDRNRDSDRERRHRSHR